MEREPDWRLVELDHLEEESSKVVRLQPFQRDQFQSYLLEEDACGCVRECVHERARGHDRVRDHGSAGEKREKRERGDVS